MQERDISPPGASSPSSRASATDQRVGTRSPSWRSRAYPGGEHHQAAEHQCLDAAAQGRDRRLQSKVFAVPDYPDDPRATRSATLAPLRRVKGSAVNRCCAKVTPTAVPRVGQGIRSPSPTRWATGQRLPLARRDHDRRDFARRALGHGRSSRQRAHRARRSPRRDHSPQGAQRRARSEILTPP